MIGKRIVFLFLASSLALPGPAQSSYQKRSPGDSVVKEESFQALAAGKLSGYINLEWDYITERLGSFSELRNAPKAAENTLPEKEANRIVQEVVQATMDGWVFAPEIANYPVPLSTPVRVQKSQPPQRGRMWVFFCSLLIASCAMGVLGGGAYLAVQHRTASYNPSNPLSALLFLSTCLFTAIWWTIDWSTIRCRTFAIILHTGAATRLRRVFPVRPEKISDNKFASTMRVN